METTLGQQWQESMEKHGTSPMMAIAIEVAAEHSISVALLRGHAHRYKLCKVRAEFINRCRRELGRSSTVIGRFMNQRDHSSVLYHINGKRR